MKTVININVKNVRSDILQTLIVTNYTFRELLKSKILFNSLLGGMALMIICYVAYSFTYGVPERVALDFGLGLISLSSVVIAIFLGVTLISREVEQRTLYMVLARPISRTSFLIGRIGGLVTILAINLFILAGMTLALYVILGGVLHSLILWCIFFSFCEAVLLLLIVIFFSLICNSVLSVLFTLLIYIMGHAVNETLVNRFTQENTIISHILKGYLYLFPNLERLNFKDLVLYEQQIPLDVLLFSLGHVIFYSLAVLILSSYLFGKRNLD